MPDRAAVPRWLDAATVGRHLPGVERAIDLATFVLTVVGRPPDGGRRSSPGAKASLPPGAEGTFAQAIAARLDAADALDARPLLGMKWIAGNPANRAGGRPAMGSVVVLNEPATGLPVAFLDASPITALRTAALSGAVVRLIAPADRPPRTALILGAGVQGRAHLLVLAACGITRVLVHDRHPERAAALAEAAPSGVAAEVITDAPRHAIDADVLVSCTSMAGAAPWIGPGDIAPDAIVVPVDYDAQVTAALVARAGLFTVDDPLAWVENRARGRLTGWPEPTTTLAMIAGARRAGTWVRPPGPAVALHQGPGLADVVFADAVLRSATGQGR